MEEIYERFARVFGEDINVYAACATTMVLEDYGMKGSWTWREWYNAAVVLWKMMLFGDEPRFSLYDYLDAALANDISPEKIINLGPGSGLEEIMIPAAESRRCFYAE